VEKRIERLEIAVGKLVTSEQRSIDIQNSLKVSMKDIANSLRIFNDHMVESKVLNAAHLRFEADTLQKLTEYDAKRSKDLDKIYKIIRDEQKTLSENATCVKLVTQRGDRLREDIEHLKQSAENSIIMWRNSAITLFLTIMAGVSLWLIKGNTP